MRVSLALAGALLGMLLSGCGFQPRPDLELPGSLRIEGGSYELRSALEMRLGGSGVRLAREDADIVLALRPEGFDERLLAVEPMRGEAREYQVAFHVRYTVRDRTGAQVLEPGEVTVLREYRVHPRERLSRVRERDVVHDEMRREAAAAIVRGLYASAGG